MKRLSLLVWLSMSTSILAVAQHKEVDTIMQLDTFYISAERYEAYSTGQKIQHINLEELIPASTDRISNTLRENTSVYIRSYGESSVSSMSIRGTSSSQSGIFWNGINIRMPSLGSTDLSLLPSAFFNNARIVYGGSSVRYGSGLIGGAIFLNNTADFSKSTAVDLELLTASYGRLATTAEITKSNSKYYFSTVINAGLANNNFQYNTNRGEEKRLENAASSILGLHSHFAMKIKDRNQLDLYIWYQESDREIPPSTTMASSEAYQVDRTLRSSIQWKSYFRKGVLNLKTAWFREYENYTDPLSGISSLINTNTLFAESEYKWRLYSYASMDAGISYNGELADIESYGDMKERQSAAVFVNYNHYFPGIKWTFLAAARQEVTDNLIAPFTPSIGLEGALIGILSHKINVSRNYRLPTLNELYWQPGGNPDIDPEKSWNAEMSLLFDFFKNKESTSLNLTMTAYTSYIDNYILWQPVDIYWAVDNIQEVWSRGVESSISLQQTLNKSKFDGRISYTYSKATNEVDNMKSDKRGKQIIYTPMHNAGGYLKFTLRSWQAAAWGNYTGKSYITSDNSEDLPGSFLTDFALIKQFIFNHLSSQLSFRVNNIFNTEYQLVAFRPMPGRNYQLTLLLTFKD